MKYSMMRVVPLAITVSVACFGACGDSGGGESTMTGAVNGLPTAGTLGTAGVDGLAGDGATAGVGFAGVGETAGIGSVAGDGATAGVGSENTAGTGVAGMEMTAGMGGTAGDGGGDGDCCPDGNCLCHGAAPTKLTSSAGEYKTASYTISTGTVYYPTDAEPPLAGIALCGGFTNTGPEMKDWGPFYASHGIVVVITTTVGTDTPDIRATKLAAAVKELKAENTKMGSMLFGMLSDRFGTSGYSMGGGGTTIASGKDATLKTSVGLAAWGGVGTGDSVPTLLLCGESDTTAPCNMSKGAYDPMTGPKMMLSIPGTTHFNWFGPTQAGMGTSGAYALAFQKVYLEGDERWKSLLLTKPSGGTVTTTIK